MDDVCDKLLVGVRIPAQESCLCAFLDATEEDLGGVGSQVGATKHGVIHLNHGQSRLTVDCAELIKNINCMYARVMVGLFDTLKASLLLASRAV
jgi:hypothetical protein